MCADQTWTKRRIGVMICAARTPGGQPPPEPCAQVRILLWALVRCINSNTPTMLKRLSIGPVTCGDARRSGSCPRLAPERQAATDKGAARQHCTLTACRPLLVPQSLQLAMAGEAAPPPRDAVQPARSPLDAT
jgi:hypothetical protein